MISIVQDVTPETLLAASYEHFVAYVLHCGRAPGGVIYDTPELAWGLTGVPSSWMNSVVRTRLAPDSKIDRIIEGVVARARERSVPLGWFITPGTQPEDLGARLEAHGLRYDEEEPGMSVDLRTLPDRVEIPDGVRVVEVLDLATLELWARTWGESYDAPEAKWRSRYEFRAAQGLGPTVPYRPYLAFWGDQPVATSDLFLGAGVAAIVWVGTVPAARRLGIVAAVTLAPLLDARRMGYRIGALTASNLGYRVYQQLGFREMCRLPVYLWSPEEH